MTNTPNILARLRRRFVEFKKDDDGIAAIEFAILAPMMVGMYFGLSEIAMAIAADRKVSHATNVAGDLATQVALVDKAGMEDVFEAALAVMNVGSSQIGKFNMEVSSYEVQPDNSRKLIGYGSIGTITKGKVPYDPNDISVGMMGDGAVVTRINYAYQPITYKFMHDTTLHETFIHQPRVAIVEFDEDGKAKFSCSAAANKQVTCTAEVLPD